MRPSVKYILALALFAQPTLALAHGEEVLVTFLLEFLVLVAFVFALFKINLNRTGKLIFVAVFTLAFVLLEIGVERLPYIEYQNTINLLVTSVPLTIGSICYFTLRSRFGKK